MSNTNFRYLAKEFPLVKPHEIGERFRIIDKIPEGYVLLKPLIAGICGSDILYFEGHKEEWKLRERLPLCLLHEGVAEVVEVGEGVSLRKGVRTVVVPLIPCGECLVCRNNLGENMCLNPRFLASTCDGLARTLFVYPAERVIPIASDLDLEIAVLAEPLSVVLNALEGGWVGREDRVAIIGDGTLGFLLALTISQMLGVPKPNLHVLGIFYEKLALMRDFAFTINTREEAGRLEEIFNSFDVVFEAVGGKAQEKTLDQALSLVRPGGRLIVLGIPAGEKIPIKLPKIIKKCLSVKGSFWSRIDHFHKALEILSDKEFKEKTKRIISSKKFKIESGRDLERALRYSCSEEAARRTPGKILLYFSEIRKELRGTGG